MKKPPRLVRLLLFLSVFCLASFPRPGRAAEGVADPIEKDLLSVLAEMDALTAELARIEEIVAVPKATSMRIEIRGDGKIAPPASAKLLLSGKTEAEREFSREERDAFRSNSGVIVWSVPALPGPHEARIVLSHPSVKRSPSFEFRPSLKPGETFLLRLTLGLAKEKGGMTLLASPEK